MIFKKIFNNKIVNDSKVKSDSTIKLPNKTKPVRFSKKVSDALPWYWIPLGITKAKGKNLKAKLDSTYVWKMKPLEKNYDESKIENFNLSFIKHSSNGLLISDNKEDKISMLKTIICHLVNKGVNLYILDNIDSEEFKFALDLKEVQTVSNSFEDHLEVIKKIVMLLDQRYRAMIKLGISAGNFDKNGYIDLQNYLIINGFVFNETEPVVVKIGGKLQTIRAMEIQPGMDIAIQSNNDFHIPSHWESVNDQSIYTKNSYNFPPIVIPIFQYSDISNVDNNTTKEILYLLNIIERFGKDVNIHLLLANHGNSLPIKETMINNFNTRISAHVSMEVSQLILNEDGGNRIPSHNIYIVKNGEDAVRLQGFSTTQQDITFMTECKQLPHEVKKKQIRKIQFEYANPEEIEIGPEVNLENVISDEEFQRKKREENKNNAKFSLKIEKVKPKTKELPKPDQIFYISDKNDLGIINKSNSGKIEEDNNDFKIVQ